MVKNKSCKICGRTYKTWRSGCREKRTCSRACDYYLLKLKKMNIDYDTFREIKWFIHRVVNINDWRITEMNIWELLNIHTIIHPDKFYPDNYSVEKIWNSMFKDVYIFYHKSKLYYHKKLKT
jgi:hypothetical protein